jgi:hypothetical protein
MGARPRVVLMSQRHVGAELCRATLEDIFGLVRGREKYDHQKSKEARVQGISFPSYAAETLLMEQHSTIPMMRSGWNILNMLFLGADAETGAYPMCSKSCQE